MTKFILLSNDFEGYFVYGYDDAGWLYHFERCTYNLPEDKIRFWLEQLGNCLHLHDFNRWYKSQGYSVIKAKEDLSFDRFWLEYGSARNKMECVPLWDKKKEAERLYIFQNIKALKWYMRRNAGWYNQPLPATFLRASWRDEWFKVQHAKPSDQ